MKQQNYTTEIMSSGTIKEGKIMAIISYLFLIGLVIALIMNSNKKNAFASFHIRQSIGLWITGLVLGVIPIVNFLGIVVFVFVIIGLVNAIQGDAKPVPFVGKYYQEWFSSL